MSMSCLLTRFWSYSFKFLFCSAVANVMCFSSDVNGGVVSSQEKDCIYLSFLIVFFKATVNIIHIIWNAGSGGRGRPDGNFKCFNLIQMFTQVVVHFAQLLKENLIYSFIICFHDVVKMSSNLSVMVKCAPRRWLAYLKEHYNMLCFILVIIELTAGATHLQLHELLAKVLFYYRPTAHNTSVMAFAPCC